MNERGEDGYKVVRQRWKRSRVCLDRRWGDWEENKWTMMRWAGRGGVSVDDGKG